MSTDDEVTNCVIPVTEAWYEYKYSNAIINSLSFTAKSAKIHFLFMFKNPLHWFFLTATQEENSSSLTLLFTLFFSFLS
jgi:hypothetical protein